MHVSLGYLCVCLTQFRYVHSGDLECECSTLPIHLWYVFRKREELNWIPSSRDAAILPAARLCHTVCVSVCLCMLDMYIDSQWLTKIFFNNFLF